MHRAKGAVGAKRLEALLLGRLSDALVEHVAVGALGVAAEEGVLDRETAEADVGQKVEGADE